MKKLYNLYGVGKYYSVLITYKVIEPPFEKSLEEIGRVTSIRFRKYKVNSFTERIQNQKDNTRIRTVYIADYNYIPIYRTGPDI